MTHYYWNDWYFGWGWFLWLGMLLLIFSSIGNWGYAYGAHRKFSTQPRSRALDILNERYASGSISRDEYSRLNTEISST